MIACVAMVKYTIFIQYSRPYFRALRYGGREPGSDLHEGASFVAPFGLRTFLTPTRLVEEPLVAYSNGETRTSVPDGGARA